MTPAKISPMICGTLILESKIGAKSMMKRTREKIITGFFKGNEKSKVESNNIIKFPIMMS